MPSKDSLVSTIMPCYNAEKYIEDAIKSVLNQTYTNLELIIVNDASTDNSQDIIDKYLKIDNRIKLVNNKKNLGVSNSRNIAIDLAQGEYIALLDSDDIWKEQKLQKQIDFMQKNSIYASYSAYDIIDEQGNLIDKYLVNAKVTYKDMLKTSQIGTLTFIYNAKKIGKHYFKNIGHEDYLYKLDILKKINCAKGIDEFLAQYRVTEKSLSSNKIKAAKWQWKIYRDIEKLPFHQSIYYFILYIIYGLVKNKKRLIKI